MFVVLLVFGWPPVSASDDGRWQTERAALEAASRTRLAWLRRPEAWHLLWSRSAVASPPAVAAGLVAWLDAGAVHGVRAEDGRPAWRSVPAGDTLIFPRSTLLFDGVGRRIGRPTHPGPSSVAAVGHLLYAVIDAGPLGPLVVCLDCSTTAQGRLLWSAPPPAGFVEFDGPPAADHAACAIVVRGGGERGPLEVVAYDARDGVVIWRRSLSTGVARDGRDHARGRRQATLVDGHVVIADHAGSVWAFERSGRPAWRYEYESPFREGKGLSDDGGRLPPGEPVVAGAESLMIAARDRGGVMVLDGAARPPRLRWETTAGERLRIVGVADGRVVVERDAGAGQAALVGHDAADGRVMASHSADAMAAGPAVMAGGVILRPIVEDVAGQPRLAIAAVDPATLQPCGRPCQTSLAAAGDTAVGAADSPAVSLTVSPAAIVVAAAERLFSLGPASP